MSKTPKTYYVYILQCSDDTLYTGSTTDLKRRVKEHNEGLGARYTRGRRPVKMVFEETHSSYSSALRRERQIKQLRRDDKKSLITREMEDERAGEREDNRERKRSPGE